MVHYFTTLQEYIIVYSWRLKGMINIFDKAHIIKLKQQGLSNREIARQSGINRKTIAKVWNKHLDLNDKLTKAEDKKVMRLIQEEITAKPKYNSSKRKRRKFNEAMEQVIDDLLAKEQIKELQLGSNHKQKITNQMIHQILLNKGFDIGITTISYIIKEKREKIRETFIKQTYELAQRLEFDFGEVKLIINGILTKAYLAVFSSPTTNFRMAYLYKSQTKKVFLDAHVRFFEDVQGVYDEVVYDNMKNVVSKFIGRNEKVLNEDLIKLSMYYGFNINVTNCFSGNEKGHVEGSVKHIRKQAFALKYEFSSFEIAQQHLKETLIKININSNIEEEKKYLKPYKAKLELAEISEYKVNKYSLIRIENNFYSIPEDLNGKEVIVKNYLNDIEVYYKQEFICRHNKIDGYLEYVLDINHYIKTFKSKPNALKNSQALANNPNLKTIYMKHYIKKPKLFIELIAENKHLSSEKMNEVLLKNYDSKIKVKELEDKIIEKAQQQINIYSKLLRGESINGN